LQNDMQFLHRINHVAEHLDSAIKAIISSQTDQKLKVKNWVLTWFLIPFHSLIDFKGFFKSIKSKSISPAIPFYAGIPVFFFVNWISNLNIYILLLSAAILMYLISFIFIAPKSMCSFSEGYFRIGAYAVFRKQEHEIFKEAVGTEDVFYFSSISQQIQIFLAVNAPYKSIHDRIDNFLNLEKANLIAQLKSENNLHRQETAKYNKALKDFDSNTTQLLSKIEEQELAIRYLVEFIKSTNIALYRQKNECFNFGDIANIVSSGITIYEFSSEDNVLKKIADERTTGISPKILELDSSYSCAKAFSSNEDGLIVDEPQPDRFVASKKLKMDYDKTWVINFHFDITQEKPLFLIVGNVILDTNEIIRAIHSMCLLKQEADIKGGT